MIINIMGEKGLRNIYSETISIPSYSLRPGLVSLKYL